MSLLNVSALLRLLDHSVQLYRWRARDTAIARLRELQPDACVRHAIHPLNAVHPGYRCIASAMSCAAPQRGIGLFREWQTHLYIYRHMHMRMNVQKYPARIMCTPLAEFAARL